MANFQKNGQNVHGRTLPAVAGQTFQIELWGPLDTFVSPPVELDVTLQSPNPTVKITRGDMVAGQSARIWRVDGLPVGNTTLQAKNGRGAIWSQVTLDAQVASAFVVTKEELSKTGRLLPKYPPSPAISALIKLLTEGTSSGLKAGIASLESAGQAIVFDEHCAGLALDIYRDSTKPGERQQAHNLIRFFLSKRNEFGWRNMFYENWGFAASKTQGPADKHFNHIHIDWVDSVQFDGSNRNDRSKWTAVPWPPAARTGKAIDTPENVGLVKAAWSNTSDPLLTDDLIKELYED
jgi:hypothetical protein